MRRRVRYHFFPTSRTYILSHLVLVLAGFIICLTPMAAPTDFLGSVVLAVGGSLIAAGVAGYVLYLHVMWSQHDERRLTEIRRSGISTVFEKRSVNMRSEYDDRLKRAASSIDVLGFGLQHLREDHVASFSEWANRANVRILVIDPETPSPGNSYANQRDREEGDDVGQISEDVRRLVRACGSLLRENNPRFRIRLYTCLPSVNIFRIDGEIFWGPYFVGGVSRNMPTFLMDGRGFVSGALMEHFEAIWSDSDLSRDVPREWLEETR